MGGATNNQAGRGIAAEISVPIGIENEANTSSTHKPRYIPIPPKTKGRFARTQNGRNKQSPVHPTGLPNNSDLDPAWTSSRQNSDWTHPPPPDPLLSMSISDLRRKIEVLQKNQDTHITKIYYTKTENKQLNRDCNDKDVIIQSLEADTSKRIATSLDKNNIHIKAMFDLHRANIVMKDRTIR